MTGISPSFIWGVQQAEAMRNQQARYNQQLSQLCSSYSAPKTNAKESKKSISTVHFSEYETAYEALKRHLSAWLD